MLFGSCIVLLFYRKRSLTSIQFYMISEKIWSLYVFLSVELRAVARFGRGITILMIFREELRAPFSTSLPPNLTSAMPSIKFVSS